MRSNKRRKEEMRKTLTRLEQSTSVGVEYALNGLSILFENLFTFFLRIFLHDVTHMLQAPLGGNGAVRITC